MQTTESLKGSSRDSDNGSIHESRAKYSVIYHGGLEVVDQSNAPEVVDSTTNLNRKSSLLQPEAYGAAPHYSDKKDDRSYYEAPHALRPEYEGLQYHEQHDGLHYYDQNDDKRPAYGAIEVPSTRDRRRCCGIPCRLFIIILVVAIILVIGAILGAALGTVLPKKSAKGSDDASLQTWSGTGLASTLAGDGSGRLLTYFQDPKGRILENSYLDGTWTLEDSANEDLSVVTTQAAYGSQLAAISYQYDGKTYRQVFFTTSTGSILSANSTETMAGGIATNWSIGRPITDDTLDPQGVGLAACYSTETMNGIRAFYPSQYGYINEVAWTFGKDYWSDGNLIDSSDPKSGVGCAVKNDNQNQYLNLYYRDSKSGRVKQAWIDYAVSDPSYSFDSGPVAWSNRSIAIGSDIAVCNDASQTEYIYYQLSGGLVTRGIVNPSSSNFETFDNTQGATVASKLACSFVDGGSMLLFQNRTNTSNIIASDLTRSGVSISNFVVP